MPLITFEPSGKIIEVPAGTELVDAARRAEVTIETPCGGKGTCGNCKVRVVSGEVDSASQKELSEEERAAGFVLACQTRLQDGAVTIDVPAPVGHKGGKFTEAGDDFDLVDANLFPQKEQYDPLAIKCRLDVPGAQMGDGLSDLDRLTRSIQRDRGNKAVEYPLSVMRRAAEALRAREGNVTVALISQPGCYHVIGIEPGNRVERDYGIAVDVGTTTVGVQLVYLEEGKVLATHVDYNDQIACGLDVISRINYARRPDRLEELRVRILKTINRLVRQASEHNQVRPEEINNAVLAGNTTMMHLLLGLKPEYIRLDPYTPTMLSSPYMRAGDIGIGINPEAWVGISPSVGSYVGGDITAGLLCTEMAGDSEQVNLFIDIGTNGELVIGNRDFLMGCACSAGPAFEGGGIEYGMRAARGAVERVQIDRETGKCSYETIGEVKPVGICGSGMIALLAELFLTGWLDAAGKLNRERSSPAIKIEGRQGVYEIVPAEESENGKPITISELDIDNIIRAKAAIYSAGTLMLQQVGIEFGDLGKIYIAGGFGRFLDLEKAKILGIVPDLPSDKYRYIGNSSLTGAYMALVSQEYRQKQYDLARRMTYIDLSTTPGYMDQYTAAMFVPHTDPQRFASVHAALKGEA